MANQVRSRVRVAGRGSKRSVSWAICSTPTGSSTVNSGQKAIAVLVPSSTLLDLIPFTIVRVRGLVQIHSDQSGAAEDQLGAFGMGIVNDVAGALGITALPGPDTDCGWAGWFVHQFFSESWLFINGTGTQDRGGKYVIDSKAMRKVAAEEDIVFMVENGSAAFGLSFTVQFRMLLKAG